MNTKDIQINDYNYPILEVMQKYGVERCFYGHLHGKAHNFAVNGLYDGINYSLISGDFVQFCPKLVL